MLEFKEKAPKVIRAKIAAYENPEEEMKLNGTQKSKYFSPESDIIILMLVDKLGYGSWSKIKKAL